jgi:hypothetical protein
MSIARTQSFDRGRDGTAPGMPENDDEARSKLRSRKLDGSYNGRSDHVARDPDDEKVSEALVEHCLDRHARIRAPEDDGERTLRPVRQLGAEGARGWARAAVEEASVAFDEAMEGFLRRHGIGVEQMGHGS